MVPVTLLTRDAVVKLSTPLILEVYKKFDMDLDKNDCGAIFLLHELMTQRTFSVNDATLYQSVCAAFIRNFVNY